MGGPFIPSSILIPVAYATAFQTVLFLFLFPWLADADGIWWNAWAATGWLCGILPGVAELWVLDWLGRRKRIR